MKEQKTEISQEIEKTMKLMDGAERLKAPADFYKKVDYRLHSRLEEERLEKKKIKGLLKPAALTAITLLNIFSAYLVLSNDKQYDDSRYQELTSISEEYNLSSSDSDWFSFIEAGE